MLLKLLPLLVKGAVKKLAPAAIVAIEAVTVEIAIAITIVLVKIIVIIII